MTNTSEKRRHRFVGVELPPPPKLDNLERELPRILVQLDRVSRGDRLEPGSLPAAPSGAVPLYEDEAGETMAVMQTAKGSSLVPWIAGTPRDPQPSEFRKGVHLTATALRETAAQPMPDPLQGVSRKETLAALLRVLERLGLLDEDRKRAFAAPQESDASLGEGDGGESDGADMELPGGGTPGKPTFPEFVDNPFFKPIAGFFAGELGSLLSGGPSLSGANSLSALGGIASNLLLQGLLDRLFPVNDSSSTGEWTVATLGPFLASQALGGDLGHAGKALARLYRNEPGPYESAALRRTDVDDKGNPIIGCEASVLIEGLEAARDTDAVGKSGVQCVGGAKKLLIGGMPSARADCPRKGHGTRSQGGGRFLVGAQKTFVGGTWGNVLDPNARPPVPTEWDPNEFPNMGDHDPSKPIPTGKGTYWDKTTGEWRMWDPARGWSATLSESADGWFGAGGGLFSSDDPWNPDSIGSNGILDLGTPEWPGAGDAATWAVPDTFFGIKMSKYFVPHDWLMDPSITNFWDIFANVEGPPFLANVDWNPLKLLLQIIYSGVTTGVSIGLWWKEIWGDDRRA